MDDLLQTLTRYYDAAPRTALRAEPFGSLVLFFTEEPIGWRYCARAALGAGPIDPGDIDRVRQRQRELGIPQAFEWIEETAPGMRVAMEAAGLPIVSYPLMVLAPEIALPAVELPGVDLSLVDADDPDLPRLGAVATVAYSSPGTQVADAGLDALAAAAAKRNPATVAFERRRIRAGATAQAAARIDGVPVAIGAVLPFGDVAQVVGIATLPAFRRRGLGQAVSALLVRHAVGRGARVVFLVAASEQVARMYAGVGFRRVGTSCSAIGA